MAAESSEGEEEGKVTGGNQILMIDDDLREMGKKAAWSVSSCKPGNGVISLRDDNLETYWQSDGAQPHLVNIQFQKKVRLQLIVLYVDFKLDESYTPSKISIRAGDGFHNLKEIKTVELVKPTGWVYLSLSGADPRETFVNTFMLQIAVLSNHLNGRDTHVRQIKIYGPRPRCKAQKGDLWPTTVMVATGPCSTNRPRIHVWKTRSCPYPWPVHVLANFQNNFVYFSHRISGWNGPWS
ncbi:hypothetical protein TanjilG_07651 [Lupinus angustifolius]|uniref:DOC domain-containing protein n=1 Tax=Lupinus angustifolius TaxID=3871 RepID=A0A1J7GVY7_LUPAN|nr:hypothetical protein TanjilG_07651 [Lupinus angustifolius]